MTEEVRLRGTFTVEGDGVRGYAYDAHDLGRRLVVELLIDGWSIDVARADDFAPEAAAIGDGCYGFGFELPEGALDDDGSVEIRVANSGEAIGMPVRPGVRTPRSLAVSPGIVRWADGLNLTGWIEGEGTDAPPGVRCLVERRTVADAVAGSFVAVGQGSLRRTKARFAVRLPDVLADGRVHRVTVLDADGRELDGSPCAVLAYADGLRAALMDKAELVDGDPRASLIDQLLTRSVPFAEVEAWISRFPAPEMAGDRGGSAVAVLLLGDDPSDALASLEHEGDAAWIALAAPERDGPGTFDAGSVLAGLEAEAEVEAIVVAPAGARFRPGALRRLAGSAARHGCPVYADAQLDTPAGPLPLFWPVFDPERQREQGYAALAFAAPAGAMVRALRRGADSCFALFDHLAREAIPLHRPEPLVMLPRPDPRLGRTLAAAYRDGAGEGAAVLEPDRVTGLPVVRVKRGVVSGTTAVAVIQPEPWTPDLARLRVSSTCERLVVSHRPVAAPPGWRNVVVAGARNPSGLRDAALRSTSATRLLLVDAGVEPEGDAVMELEGRLAGGAVAAGGLLLDEQGVASAGLVLGLSLGAVPAFAGCEGDDGGYGGALGVARECGALDPAILMLDRQAAIAVGGFDAVRCPGRLGGVDLCLRLRAAGGRLVVSPAARFLRLRAWQSRGGDPSETRALDFLRWRWGEDLGDDPFYHPGLNSDAAPFSALAWPPRHRSLRRPRLPRSSLTNDEAR